MIWAHRKLFFADFDNLAVLATPSDAYSTDRKQLNSECE